MKSEQSRSAWAEAEAKLTEAEVADLTAGTTEQIVEAAARNVIVLANGARLPRPVNEIDPDEEEAFWRAKWGR